MSTAVTKKDLTDLKENLEESLKIGLTGLKENLEETLKKSITGLRENLEESSKEGIRDLVRHFNDSQEVQNNQLKQISADLLQVNVKLDAIMSGEVLVTRKQLERLLHALKEKGIELNEVDILAA